MSGLHFPDLSIKGFRGFKELCLPQFGRVTLITGKNNTGKTSVLEALYIHAHSASLAALARCLDSRLESFLRSLVPQPNPLYDHAVNSVQEISQPLFSHSDELKAIIHTWLAWQKEPGRPFGTAISAQFLNANAPEAVALASWLKRLFHGG